MIKIFEDENDQPNNSGATDPVSFSLNLDPTGLAETKDPAVGEPQTREMAAEGPAEPALEQTLPDAESPWKTVAEGQGAHTWEAPSESDAPPVADAEAVSTAPGTLTASPEPVQYEDGPRAEPEVVKTPYQPDTSDETIRNSGLAWSAGIIFFGSVIFMMFLGWGFDLLFGSSPYGLVGGIVFGSLIGFIQFFRISSQIFKK